MLVSNYYYIITQTLLLCRLLAGRLSKKPRVAGASKLKSLIKLSCTTVPEMLPSGSTHII